MPSPPGPHELCISVFLKDPVPGFVKTRLASTLGKRRAAALYRAFLEDQLAWMGTLPRVEKRLLVAAAPGQEREALARIGKLAAAHGDGFSLRPQRGRGLGARLRAAFREMLEGGPRAVIIVGTDAPLLGPAILEEAREALESRDVVLGPSRDGGYYLIGLRAEAPSLFSRIPWSTGSVLETTLRRVRAAGLAPAILPVLGDVDTAADLEELRRDLIAAWRAGQRGFPVRTMRMVNGQDGGKAWAGGCPGNRLTPPPSPLQ